MNANLVFSADLLTNAKIVEELKLDNTYANAISERWDNMISDSIYYEGAEKVYTRTGFFDAANQARTQNQLLTFAEYTAREDAKTTPNRPYAVKQVLEDNLLGEATSFSEASSWAAPYLVPVIENEDATFDRVTSISEGQDVTLLASGSDVAAYLNKLQDNDKAQVYLNQGTSTLSPLVKGTDYTIDTANGTITIKADKLKLGDNDLKLVVENYQPVKLTLTVNKEQENVSLSAPESIELGNDVTITCNSADHVDGVCDFFKYLNKNTAVRMTGPDGTTRNVLPDGQEGTNLGWKVNGTTLTIGANLFKETQFNNATGTYTLTLAPDYYTEQTVSFEVKAKDNSGNTEVTTKDAPTPTSAEKDFSRDFKITFGMNNDDYMKAITSIKVNSTAYTSGSVWNNNKYSIAVTDGLISLGNSAFTEDNNIVTITATDYKELTVTITKDGKLVVDNNPGSDNGENNGSPEDKDTETGLTPPTVELSVPSMFSDYYTLNLGMNEAYCNAIESIAVNNTTYTKINYSFSMTATSWYIAEKSPYKISIGAGAFVADSTNTIVIKANGYKTLTLNYTKQ